MLNGSCCASQVPRDRSPKYKIRHRDKTRQRLARCHTLWSLVSKQRIANDNDNDDLRTTAVIHRDSGLQIRNQESEDPSRLESQDRNGAKMSILKRQPR